MLKQGMNNAAYTKGGTNGWTLLKRIAIVVCETFFSFLFLML